MAVTGPKTKCPPAHLLIMSLASTLFPLADAQLAQLWATVDQQEVALVPALLSLSGQDAAFAPFVTEAVQLMKTGAALAPRSALHDETKRRFLAAVNAQA